MAEVDILHEKNARSGTQTSENLKLLASTNKFSDTDGAVYSFIYH